MPKLEARIETRTESPIAMDDHRAASHYRPKPGFVWNPLKKHRNIPCLCESGRKAKDCCGRHEALPVDVAKKVTRALKWKGLA